MNSSLEYWQENVADFPDQDADGNWFDLETGLTYADYVKSEERAAKAARLERMREKHGDAIVAAKSAAKALGWVALTGTPAQKDWAAQIRAKLIPQFYADAAVLAGNIKDAKFWIENRDVALNALQENIRQLAESINAQVARDAAKKRLATAVKAEKKAAAERRAACQPEIINLFAASTVIPAVPNELGTRCGEHEIDGNSVRVFVRPDIQSVYLLVRKASGGKEVRLASVTDELARQLYAAYR